MSALPPPRRRGARSRRSATRVPEPLAHAQVREANLLRPVDHLDVDAGAEPHAIEERVAIARLANGARATARLDVTP